MKKLILLITIIPLLFSVILLPAQQVEKTFIKSFNVLGMQEVVLEFDNPVEVVPWSNSSLRIQMNVELAKGTTYLLKAFAQSGRYTLLGRNEGETLRIFAPGLQHDLLKKNADLEEHITFEVYVPEGVLVKQGSSATTLIEITGNDLRL